jgi:hypothetical protein
MLLLPDEFGQSALTTQPIFREIEHTPDLLAVSEHLVLSAAGTGGEFGQERVVLGAVLSGHA